MSLPAPDCPPSTDAARDRAFDGDIVSLVPEGARVIEVPE